MEMYSYVGIYIYIYIYIYIFVCMGIMKNYDIVTLYDFDINISNTICIYVSPYVHNVL